MKEVIITLAWIGGLSHQPDTNKIKLAHTIDHIQDMKEWMQEDINNDNVITDLGEFYMENRNEVEDLLIEIYNTK